MRGRLEKDGVTFYTRGGRTIMRSATSDQPKRRTLGQFVARQQLSHSCRLWSELKRAGEPMFGAGDTAYGRFRSLMRRTPVVFVPKKGAMMGATFLLPEMPISEGVLPEVRQWLDEVDGQTVFATSLTRSDVKRGDKLRLYRLRQVLEGVRPVVRIEMQEVGVADFQTVGEQLVLMGEEFSDDMRGWALVHVQGSRCSSQSVVTRCSYYERFATDEALQEAAKSYGGLTDQKSR